jgi:hypothetical protein
LFASAIFFLVSEWLIDPLINDLTPQGFFWGYTASFILKFGLVLSLKPLEKILERFLLQTANKPVQDLTV